jgi:tetratricopeptide (TPR) repeat protein
VGRDHVTVGRYLINQIDPLLDLARADEASAAARRSLAILEPALGPRHPTTALALSGEARARLALGDLAGADLAARRALAAYRDAPGPDRRWLADTLVLGARVAATDARWSEAIEGFREATAIIEALPPPLPDWAESTTVAVASIWIQAGGCAEVLPALERAAEQASGEQPIDGMSSAALAMAGRCHLEAGRLDRAEQLAALSERAWQRAGGGENTLLPLLRFDLARATYRRDRAAAVRQARAALTLLAAVDHPSAREVEREIGRWLAARSPDP